MLELDWQLFLLLHLPRMVLAVVAGVALGIAGSLMQSIVRNPLASPEILGVNSGAGLFAVAVLSMFPLTPGYLLPVFTFLGGSLAGFITFWFGLRGDGSIRFALVGIAVGAVATACTQFFIILRPVEAHASLVWLVGSLWGRTWTEVQIVSLFFVASIPILVFLQRKLELLQLGPVVTKALGESTQRLYLLGFIAAVLLTSATVAVVGAISFVGLVAPHLAKLSGARRQASLLLFSAAWGAGILLVSDLLGRLLLAPVELPAGIFTSILGAPFLLGLLYQSHRKVHID